METEPVRWEPVEKANPRLENHEIDFEGLYGNGEKRNLLARAQELDSSSSAAERMPGAEEKGKPRLSTQEQWNTLYAQRDQMHNEIKRGWEFLEQVRRELVVLQARLDEWTGYELVCGNNPLSEYMQAIVAKERIEQYLPTWLKRREQQLYALDCQMQHWENQHAVAHPPNSETAESVLTS